jgi:hypothetical protein
MLAGIRSEPVKGWIGAPVCREHLAESLSNTSGHPVIKPSAGFETATATLQ